ncbi:hypothetical protein AMS68_005922 [Peltaster fructicola]|uniref:Phosphatidylinositol 4-kinase n=1 Tax=Peltaster fructicola TaxID=286661 RepID=A0A6H0Y0H0_9PEZI|nr:hypothetical protein AMS68_005922 [Peltaster fructicola]
MPPRRPVESGYARIAQAEEDEEEQLYSDNEDPFHDSHTLSESFHSSAEPRRRDGMHQQKGTYTPQWPGRRKRTNSGVDIKAINARLERWAEEIKERFTLRRFRSRDVAIQQLEIYSSVFQAPESIRPATKHTLEEDYDDSHLRMSKLEFDDIVESVRTAIELGTHPTLISQGSSGSYFARNTSGKIVGVFKPKDEEPYASKNPKWTKWIHRNLFPFAFGRACLIPNLSYVSEAAAYLLDVQLRTNLVPYTDVVSLSSKSFFYDYFDRRAFYQKHKPFPEKQGSFQVFLKGFKGATEFFKEHPWPDQTTSYFRDAPKKKKKRGWTDDCRRGSQANGVLEEYNDNEEIDEEDAADFWSADLQQSFREQLEKLVILDYIMRNTDRGTDNWMIRIDTETRKAEIVLDPPSDANGTDEYSRREGNMSAKPSTPRARPHIGAIDNSLSWPWKHPDAWRSYPFGWLFLPVSLIGQPFSERSRKHFLPLLTSKEWWIDTQAKLRACFELDADFKEKMFARQMAVMKGQAWNVVEALKTADHGPLELTRRTRVCVWDDVVEIPVAVPLARPSEEMRRKAQSIRSTQQTHPANVDEMDISTAHGSAPQINHDLLGIFATSQREPHRSPFNHSRQNSSEAVPQVTANGQVSDVQAERRPTASRSKTSDKRVSLDLSRNRFDTQPTTRPRPLSLHTKRSAHHDDAEDDDGDIGFAAANDQEGSRRKVIVERLEVVKTKPPFFTWC